MEHQNLEDKFSDSDRIWLSFFFLSSWVVITVLFLTGIPLEMLSKAHQTKKDTMEVLPVILENDKENPVEMPEVMPNLSDITQKESGKLTDKEGFEALSEDSKLEFAAPGQQNNADRDSKLGALQTDRTNDFTIQIIELPKTGFDGLFDWGTGKKDSVPLSMEFHEELALSWNSYGEPVIPTIHYKHYEYYRQMLDKIQKHWAPPGGNPYPVATNSYHTMTPGIPGTTTYQTFPEQEVAVIFFLNPAGSVVSANIVQSMGYQTVNASILDAINDAKNFGRVPAELLKNNLLEVQITFKLYRPR